MCTDVDRNDKSRICHPETVKVIGRRQIEMYSHVIHTVDHVEGILREEFDGLDAFMTHMWAVTVTGAPKSWAVKWIEDHEKSPRKWYGGAVGFIGFDGNINTGLTLRTIHVKDGVSQVRVGATVLYDSDPMLEENETQMKGAALLKVLEPQLPIEKNQMEAKQKIQMKILLVDHEDSFVHTLSGYFRRFGADITTLRPVEARKRLGEETFDLVVLSPGPGDPETFKLRETIDLCVQKNIPQFGVCLGLQGLVTYFGGELSRLSIPYHGKKSKVFVTEGQTEMLKGLGSEITVGRYHSLHASQVPEVLAVTARTEDGIVMAVEHKSLPIYGVQFHPESIMSLEGSVGLKIIENIITLTRRPSHDEATGK